MSSINYTKTVRKTKTIVNDVVVTEEHTDTKHQWLCDDGDGDTIYFTIRDGFLVINNGTFYVTVTPNDDVVTVLKKNRKSI